MTKIEWTEKTWNPVVGCSVLTPGCTNCYAMRMAWRLANNPATPHYAGTVVKVNGKPVWTGKVALAPERVLTEPLRRRKPTTYFVNSMGDLFHEDVPDAWIDRVFAVMALAPRHTFQVLTKRAARMREYMATPDRVWEIFSAVRWHIDDEYRENSRFDDGETPWPWPLPNVWLGVSAERQREWDERKEHLRQTPAAIRFASFEPLLGAIENIPDWLSWAICGGESGPGARPMNPDWPRALRDQCQAAQVPFFFKQWGEWAFGPDVPLEKRLRCECATVMPDGRVMEWESDYPGARLISPFMAGMVCIGKTRAGRLLDGRTWDEMPGERNG